MVTRVRGLFAGVAAAALLALASSYGAVTAAGGTRTIALYNIHTKETVAVVYKKDGRYVEAGLEQINHILRDHRKNESTKIDPELIDLIWEMHSELGSKEPIHIISGYRSHATNELLRKTVGGQASESRHILGKAVDVHFPDVPVKHLRYSALVRERGGVGYYPTSAIPFVHVDTDRVRSWPRLPRPELALLFPSGQTKHVAAEGGPITREDVRLARARHPELAAQIAELRDPRARQAAAVAAVQPALPPPAAAPRLVQALQPAERPRPPAAASLSAADRARLTELFGLAAPTPQLVSGPMPARRPQPALPSLSGAPEPRGLFPERQPAPAPKVAAVDPAPREGRPLSDAGRFALGGWAPAPAFDDEHPEELSYRPFPIAPFLTETAAEPLMAEMIPHDVARTVDFIDQAATVVPLRFRAGAQAARLLWAQQFTGDPVGIAKLREAQAPPAQVPGAIHSRAVRTSDKR
jgi:uncharacterized protein YcbK (DUF882 family)